MRLPATFSRPHQRSQTGAEQQQGARLGNLRRRKEEIDSEIAVRGNAIPLIIARLEDASREIGVTACRSKVERRGVAGIEGEGLVAGIAE